MGGREAERQGEREREGVAAYTSYRRATPSSNNKNAAAAAAAARLWQYGAF